MDLGAIYYQIMLIIIAKHRNGSTMDFEDAKAILIRQNEKLDLKYMETIAKQEQLEEDLQNLFTAVEKYKLRK